MIKSLAQAKEAGAAVIACGSFINTVSDFTIVRFLCFHDRQNHERVEKETGAAPFWN